MSRPRKRWTSDSGEQQLGLFDPPDLGDALVGLVCNPSLAPDPTPVPKPGQLELPAPAEESDSIDVAGPALVGVPGATIAASVLDRGIVAALCFLDDSARRWAMRRASGQSGADLKAAIAYELFSRPVADWRQPGHYVSGCPNDPWLGVAPDVGLFTPAVEVDLDELAVRARRLLKIPVRDEVAPRSRVWAVSSKEGPILYAAETSTLSRAAELMEPGDVGDAVLKMTQVDAGKLPAFIEIRRLPLSQES